MSNGVASSEKLSVAALISVILRRKVNRTIDVKWLIENEEYARKIIELCREQGLTDLNEYADHLESLMFGQGTARPKSIKKENPISSREEEVVADNMEENEDAVSGSVDRNKYVGRLR